MGRAPRRAGGAGGPGRWRLRWRPGRCRPRRAVGLVALLALAGFVLAGCGALGGGDRPQLVVYSSRTQSLVHPLLEQFARETGIDIRVRYASTAELVNALLEEGERSAADVLYLSDAGGWGPLREAGLLAELPRDVLEKVDPRFRSPDGQWVGVSGRSKVIVYNKDRIDERELPDSVMDLTDPKWKGRFGWAPTHGEWQILVTAIRLTEGEEAARQWLEAMKANEPKEYPNLISIVRAVADGEVDIGVANHYYVPRLMEELGPDFAARNHFLKHGDPGAVIDVTGLAILKATDQREAAERFVRFLLSEEAQRYFTQETKEYPMIPGVPLPEGVPPLEELEPPAIDQSDLGQLRETLNLLRETGVLP
ncbi:iron ABC transporter substrate-binding protein [Thermaerobacter sp. FW80]|uniref:iron ABC transporter substrate-binding protein n=1 Tax=Thermaerobacter sp. FW80 TaxID=2546351 RepID=UPI001FA9ABF7|nr:iron ABC transporter substrate-binding protein [Thermaerobacter sp. FW80]